MSGKSAAGLVLIVVGVVLALWGINLMSSFGSQIAGAIGLRDNTGPIAIGGGAALALIGLVLALQDHATGIADNVASALCYLLGLITGILFLVLAPYNKNPAIRFHAFQSIFLHVAGWVATIVLNVVFGILHLWSLSQLVSLAFLAIFVYMIVMAYQGKKIVLPVIGPMAQQQAGN